MSSTYTINLGLRKPEHRDPETVELWDGVINNNWDRIDVAVGDRTYPSHNYIVSGEPLSTSLNKLDIALKAAALIINRSDILFPEYPGAVFTPSGSSNIGTLISDMENATYRFNYYKWLTTEVTMQSYDISVKWQVPATWLSWQASALTIDFCTEDDAVTNCKVDATICKDGALATTFPVVPWATGVASSVAGTWGTQITFTSANLATLSLVAGSVLNILIRMYSKFDVHSHYVKIGNITLSYVG